MIEECFCSTLSSQAQESLHATASYGEVWFLLENHGIWENKAFEQSDVPETLKVYLSAFIKAIPRSRVLMIKSGHGRVARGITFFIVNSRESDAVIYEFTFQNYENILDLDIPAVLAGDDRYRENQRKEPVYLVCTNGKRDPCCAKFGLPVYAELLGQVGDQVWQSSHVGGHRFAANLVCFPHGLYFGRLSAGATKQVVEHYQNGKIFLEAYRGRSCYPEEIQAAEYYLRLETGMQALEAFRLMGIDQGNEYSWQIHFEQVSTGKLHTLHVTREISAIEIQQSCLKAETAPLVTYHLVQHLSV